MHSLRLMLVFKHLCPWPSPDLHHMKVTETLTFLMLPVCYYTIMYNLSNHKKGHNDLVKTRVKKPTSAAVFLSWRQSLFSNDSVISGMVVMRFSWIADLDWVLSAEETRRARWWVLTSTFSSLGLMWLGEAAVVAAWSLFNFMASNCDCREKGNTLR